MCTVFGFCFTYVWGYEVYLVNSFPKKKITFLFRVVQQNTVRNKVYVRNKQPDVTKYFSYTATYLLRKFNVDLSYNVSEETFVVPK